MWFDDPSIPLPNSSGDERYDSLDLLAHSGDTGFDLVSVNVYELLVHRSLSEASERSLREER